MREILFRGKNLYNHKWIEGYPVLCEAYGMWYIIPKDNLYRMAKVVDEDTISQYTGLQDKNGVKIFEGDILKIDVDIEYKEFYDLIIIKITNMGVQYSIKSEPNILYSLQSEFELSDYSVIGNIFDNPELLENKEDK